MAEHEGSARQDEIRIQLELLEVYRRNLRHYMEQAGRFGGSMIPVVIFAGAEESREKIRRIKEDLRGLGVNVEDDPFDEPTGS